MFKIVLLMITIVIPRLGFSALGSGANHQIQAPLIDAQIDIQDVQVDEPQVLNRIDSAQDIYGQDFVSSTSDEILEEICIEQADEINEQNEQQVQTLRSFQDARQQPTCAQRACVACTALPICATLISMPIGLSFLFAQHLDSDSLAIMLGFMTTASCLGCCATLCECCYSNS